MATIFIERLCVDTVIGICEWEREVPQSLFFDIEASCDIGAAAKSDAIEDALDYAAMAQSVIEFVQASQRVLLEALLEDLAAHLLAQFPVVDTLALTVRKPLAINEADCAGIRISVIR